MPSLPDLPNELLTAIFTELDKPAVWAIALTCRHFYALVESFIYNSIKLVDDPFAEEAASVGFKTWLLGHQDRAQLIRSFTYQIAWQEDWLEDEWHEERAKAASQLLHLLPNLVDLDIEIEYWDLESLEGYDRIFARAVRGEVLTALKTCKVYFHDVCGSYEFRDAGPLLHTAQIFEHPTLERLTFCRLGVSWSTVDSLGSLKQCERSTLLRELHFRSCDVNPEGLVNILGAPRALKVLTVTNDMDCIQCENWTVTLDRWIPAFRMQSHSLEKLIFRHENKRQMSDPIDLHEMVALKHLQINGVSLFGRISMEHDERVSPSDLQHILPPNLETLHLQQPLGCEYEFLEKLLRIFVQEKPLLAPRLKTILVESEASSKVVGIFADLTKLCQSASIELQTEVGKPSIWSDDS